jgi:hypothetical protein
VTALPAAISVQAGLVLILVLVNVLRRRSFEHEDQYEPGERVSAQAGTTGRSPLKTGGARSSEHPQGPAAVDVPNILVVLPRDRSRGALLVRRSRSGLVQGQRTVTRVRQVPDLEVPEPPAEQRALRALLERLLPEYHRVATYQHEDTFWEYEGGGRAVYGWGTNVTPLRSGRPFTVWFDGLDDDIAVWAHGHGWRRKNRGLWLEWQDLSDMQAVLTDMERRLRALLADFT